MVRPRAGALAPAGKLLASPLRLHSAWVSLLARATGYVTSVESPAAIERASRSSVNRYSCGGAPVEEACRELSAPQPTPQIGAVPATTPFVAPEELARRAGRAELLRLGANESAFGPPPRRPRSDARRGAADSWYGDPESVDLRAALAHATAA